MAINRINFLTILKLLAGSICNSRDKHGGEIWCEQKGDRVIMKGKAVFYMKVEIELAHITATT